MGPGHSRRGGARRGRRGGRRLSRVLVTNDDGVSSLGLVALARAAADQGHEVVVAAPLRDHSGASAAIGMTFATDGIEALPVELDGLPDVAAYGLEAPPALAVMAARLGAFGAQPDLVVSGINPGPNTGRSVMHSGTVGAALTAANFGISGLAVSIGIGAPLHFETAATVAMAALDWLVTAPTGSVLNVNVPNRPLGQLRGVRWGRLAPFGTVRAALGERRDGRLQLELRDTEHELDPDTDTALVTAGFVSVTALVGVRAADEVDAPAAIERELSLAEAAS